MRLTEICEIERAKSDKVYPKGAILIQISATRGQTILLEEDQVVKASMYAVLTPTIDVESVYLRSEIERRMEAFLNTYGQGLNIAIDNFKYMDIKMADINTQKVISQIIKFTDIYMKTIKKEEEAYRLLKKIMQARMFV